jgi:hypothetical protein
MSEDFDKGHAAGARNIPYYVYVAPQGLLQIQEMSLYSVNLRQMILLASLLLSLGREKNPHFEEEVAALYGKEDHLIVVTCCDSYLMVLLTHI